MGESSGDLPVSQSNNAPSQTERLSTSSSDGFQNSANRNENQHSESNPNLNSFFDSYVSNVNRQDTAEVETVCSDSVSRYDGDGGSRRHHGNTGTIVQIRTSRSGSANARQPMPRY